MEPMLAPALGASDPSDRTQPADLTLLIVDGERSREAIDRVEIDAESEFELTVDAVADVTEIRAETNADCLVTVATGDGGQQGGDDIAALNGRLEAIRAAAPDLPIVVLAADRTPELADAVRSYDWTAVIERDDAADWLVDRVRDLLERHRLAALSRRSLASVELTGDAVAFVAPDDEIQFANRSFAMQFGYDPGTLPGRSWRALFTDSAVDLLESTAIPTARDGWRWAGSCTGRRKRGATFPARIRLGGLDDGSLVFVVDEADDTGLEG